MGQVATAVAPGETLGDGSEGVKDGEAVAEGVGVALGQTREGVAVLSLDSAPATNMPSCAPNMTAVIRVQMTTRVMNSPASSGPSQRPDDWRPASAEAMSLPRVFVPELASATV
jgi:hypothetical protein